MGSKVSTPLSKKPEVDDSEVVPDLLVIDDQIDIVNGQTGGVLRVKASTPSVHDPDTRQQTARATGTDAEPNSKVEQEAFAVDNRLTPGQLVVVGLEDINGLRKGLEKLRVVLPYNSSQAVRDGLKDLDVLRRSLERLQALLPDDNDPGAGIKVVAESTFGHGCCKAVAETHSNACNS